MHFVMAPRRVRLPGQPRRLRWGAEVNDSAPVARPIRQRKVTRDSIQSCMATATGSNLIPTDRIWI